MFLLQSSVVNPIWKDVPRYSGHRPERTDIQILAIQTMKDYAVISCNWIQAQLIWVILKDDETGH